jgi:peptidoglycan hydrolase-like protein with peptidoglycan-binding domain
VGSLSRKAIAWAAGAALAVGGCTAGIVIAAQGGGLPGTDGAAAPAAAGPPPLNLVSVSPVSLSPAGGAQDVDGAADIVVTYNQPLPATAPLPQLSPAIAGTWRRTGNAAIFRPARGYAAGTRVTVTVAGLGNTRNHSESSSFKTPDGKTLRLQEILAQLGYLPLTWTPAAGAAGAAGGMNTGGVNAGSAAAQLSAVYSPPSGTFQWQRGYPARLHSFWSPGTANTIDRGAITSFEADHGLPANGVAGPAVWKALLAAAAGGERNTHGYSYAIVSKHSPETLTIWHDGRKVFSSLANTGIAAAPTPDGTFPVYDKLPFQVMRGSNPDGSYYADPVWWISYFHGGDAVHYYPRGSYGWPQSVGCVELPYSAAKRAYQYLLYGTLVTVTGQPLPGSSQSPQARLRHLSRLPR